MQHHLTVNFISSPVSLPPFPSSLHHVISVACVDADGATDASVVVFGKDDPADAYISGYDWEINSQDEESFSPFCLIELPDELSSVPAREFGLVCCQASKYVVLTCGARGYAQCFDLVKCEAMWEKTVQCQHLVCDG